MRLRSFLFFPVVIVVLAISVWLISTPAHSAQHEAAAVIVMTDAGHGSGVYIGNGEIITAAHVAKEASSAGKMTIKNSKGETAQATVLWYDAKTDVALLKLDVALNNVVSARLACERPDVNVGDRLEAIGAPLNLINIHTYGYVAGIVTKRAGDQVNFIADLTIAPGNSGGPVFSDDGTLAGITVATAVATLDGGLSRSLVALSYIIPKSVICGELKSPHDAPVFTS